MSIKTAKKPLKWKLIKSSLFILLFAFAIASVLVFSGINKVSSGIVELVTKRSQVTTDKLNEYSAASSKRIKQNLTLDIRNKTLNSLKKDSASLVQLFMDNSFLQVRDFVQTVFRDDKDILAAAFFVYDGSTVQPWHYVDVTYPNGLEIGAEYSMSKKQWLGIHKKTKVRILDSIVSEVIKTAEPKIVETTIRMGQKEIPVLEAYIPVYQKFKNVSEMASQVKAGLKEGNPIGFLRYTISLESLNETIKAEQESLKTYIFEIAEGNKQTSFETEKIGSGLRDQILFLLGLAVLPLLIGSFFFTKYTSTKITKPVLGLVDIASKISLGEYKQEINIETDDEIGILAASFRDMSVAIVKRDEELAMLNKGLEDLVEQRTLQLKDEMKKVKNILDSMKQSVFTINPDLKVVAPVSKYSEEIFKQDISNKFIDNFLFSNLDKKSEKFISAHTALTTVFDSDDLQWMLMEDNLPKEIDLDIGGDLVNLTLSYSPLYNDSGFVHQIMFVVEDITQEKRLMKQIEEERKANYEKSQLLSEISIQTPEDVQSFFTSVSDLLSQCIDQSEDVKKLTHFRMEIFRNLHTVKGNSKVYGFEKLASHIHHVEQYVSHLKDEDIFSEDDVNYIQSEVLNGQRIISSYFDIAEKILKVPFKLKSQKIKVAHTNFMLIEDVNDKNLIKNTIHLLAPYLPLDIFNGGDSKRQDLTKWLLSEVLNRGIVFKSNTEDNYLSGMSEAFKKLVYLCERDIVKNHDETVKRMTADIPYQETLYDDLVDLKIILDSSNCYTFRDNLQNYSPRNQMLKELLLQISKGFKSDYMFVVRCFEIVNTYAADKKVLSQQIDPSFTVYESHWDSLVNKILNLKTSDKYMGELMSCLNTVNYIPFRKSLIRYYYMIDNLAPKLGKKIKFQVKGNEAYLPNHSIEKLNGVLTHLIRNSVDHGIELPEERLIYDKLETGSIAITTYDQRDKLKIIIEDDGRGIDGNLLMQKAIEKRIITKEQANKMTDQQKVDLIFIPEFSIKESISDISGRGIGMDAVKVSVERDLGGKLSVQSKVGLGTEIVIEIPKYLENLEDFNKAA